MISLLLIRNVGFMLFRCGRKKLKCECYHCNFKTNLYINTLINRYLFLYHYLYYYNTTKQHINKVSPIALKTRSLHINESI